VTPREGLRECRKRWGEAVQVECEATDLGIVIRVTVTLADGRTIGPVSSFETLFDLADGGDAIEL
jgi:hypothetical protein